MQLVLSSFFLHALLSKLFVLACQSTSMLQTCSLDNCQVPVNSDVNE